MCGNSIMRAAIFPLSRMPSQHQTIRPLAFEWWTEGRSEYLRCAVAHHEMQLFMLGAMISMRLAGSLGGITIWQMAGCFGFNPRHHHHRHRQPSLRQHLHTSKTNCVLFSRVCGAERSLSWWCREVTHRPHRWIPLICKKFRVMHVVKLARLNLQHS